MDSSVFHTCADRVMLKSRQRKRRAAKDLATASGVEASARALSIPTSRTRRSCGCLFKNKSKKDRPGNLPSPNRLSDSSFRLNSALYRGKRTAANSQVKRSPLFVQAAMYVAMTSSSSGEKKLGRPSLTGASDERRHVRRLEREAPVAVMSLATLPVPSASRAATSFSRLSDINRVPLLGRSGVASAAVDPAEQGGDVMRRRAEKKKGVPMSCRWQRG